MKFSAWAMLGFLLLFSQFAKAQDFTLYEEVSSILYRREATLGFMTHTSGLGFSARRGLQKTFERKRIIELDLVSMKHTKEDKTHVFKDSPGFVYGKLNYLTLLRCGYGIQQILYAKADRSGVEVRFNGSVGLSTGILKPVYLDIIIRSGQYPFEQSRREPTRYDPLKHQLSDIYGRSSFGYGMSELTFHPGGYVKSGFSFEFSKNDRSIRSIETGAVLDVFPKALPIMAFTSNNSYYFSLYLAGFFGGKW